MSIHEDPAGGFDVLNGICHCEFATSRILLRKLLCVINTYLTIKRNGLIKTSHVGFSLHYFDGQPHPK